MSPWLWISSGLIGYLLGSFSAARAVFGLFAPEKEIDGIRMEFSGSEATFQSNVISATTVRHHLGNQYGCLTSILDILKAAIPALIFRLLYPDADYYLAAAGMATVGHIWPIYYRFKGGRGMSPILGGMLVVDWAGVIITQIAGGISGLATKKLGLIVGAGFALMIPWTWFRFHSWPECIYMIAMNLLFWIAIIPEAKQIQKIQKDGGLDEFIQSEHQRMFGQDNDQSTSIPPFTDLKAWKKLLLGKKK
jgi:acyl phosphate:glycerol-3-phosphate acyltransferase